MLVVLRDSVESLMTKIASFTQPTFFPTQADFRAWLKRDHQRSTELLVGFYRKDSGKPSITYSEALDEALCFGWIDGIRSKLDEASYTVRFTPRRPGSIWSLVNIKRVGELKQLARMQPAGLAAFEKRDEKKSQMYSYERDKSELDSDFEKRFRADKKAWAFFQQQAPSYRRTSIWWVISAKRQETRERRLATLIEVSAASRRLDMLNPKNKQSDQK